MISVVCAALVPLTSSPSSEADGVKVKSLARSRATALSEFASLVAVS